MDHPERLVGALQYLELQLAVYEQQHLQQKDVESGSSSQFNMCCNTFTGYISFKNFYRLPRTAWSTMLWNIIGCMLPISSAGLHYHCVMALHTTLQHCVIHMRKVNWSDSLSQGISYTNKKADLIAGYHAINYRAKAKMSLAISSISLQHLETQSKPTGMYYRFLFQAYTNSNKGWCKDT